MLRRDCPFPVSKSSRNCESTVDLGNVKVQLSINLWNLLKTPDSSRAKSHPFPVSVLHAELRVRASIQPPFLAPLYQTIVRIYFRIHDTYIRLRAPSCLHSGDIQILSLTCKAHRGQTGSHKCSLSNLNMQKKKKGMSKILSCYKPHIMKAGQRDFHEKMQRCNDE